MLQDTRSAHTQKRITFLNANNEYMESEIKNTTPFTIIPKKMINKTCVGSTLKNH